MRDSFEPQPGDAPRAPQPKPASIDRRAIAIGCLLGWWMYLVQNFSFSLLVRMLPMSDLPVGPPSRFSPVGILVMVASFFCDFAVGAIAGFFTARNARHSKMKHAAITAGLVSLLRLYPLAFLIMVATGAIGSGSTSIAIWSYGLIFLRALLSIAGALCGGNLVVSLDRNRNVKID